MQPFRPPRRSSLPIVTSFVISIAAVTTACDSDDTGGPRIADSGVAVSAPEPTVRASLDACGTPTAAPLPGPVEAVESFVLDEPAVGVAFRDPVFGTCVTRLTDHAVQPPIRFARTTYSRRQPFNADGSRLLVMGGAGGWHLYDPGAIQPVGTLAGLAGDIEPIWHPSDAGRLYHLPEEGLGMQLLERDIATDRSRVLADLGPRLRAIWPTAAILSTRSDGYPSQDARYWAWLVETADAQPLGIVVWDASDDRLVAQRAIDDSTGADIDWVSMSPGGDWVVVAGSDRTLAFDRLLRPHGTLHEGVEHADLALDAAGRDVYVSIDFADRDGPLFMVDLATLERTDLVSMYVRRAGAVSFTSLHVSGKAHARPGWAVVSTYRARSDRTEWFQDKIMLVELVRAPRIVRLADHHSRYAGYWTEPHAVPDPNLSQVVFNTNWYRDSDDDIDTYRVTVPADALF